jgi:hypothetical protein
MDYCLTHFRLETSSLAFGLGFLLYYYWPSLSILYLSAKSVSFWWISPTPTFQACLWLENPSAKAVFGWST